MFIVDEKGRAKWIRNKRITKKRKYLPYRRKLHIKTVDDILEAIEELKETKEIIIKGNRMPTHEFKCPNCKRRIEVFFKPGEEIPKEIICDKCSVPNQDKVMAYKVISSPRITIDPRQELQF